MSFHDKLLSRRGRPKGTPLRRSRAEDYVSSGLREDKSLDIDGTNPETTISADQSLGEATGELSSKVSPSHDQSRELIGPPSFSVRSLAERWGCSQGAVRNQIRKGTLRHFRVGDLIRVAAQEVERFEWRH